MTVDPARLAAARTEIEAAESRFLTTSIGAFVEARCATLGDALALDVFDRGERISYRALDEATNRIGHALRAIGIAKGDRVGCMMPNRLAYPLTWLALAKIGAVHVPVNTRYTAREVHYVLADSGASALVVDPSFLDTVDGGGRPEGLRDDRVLVLDGPRTPFVDFDAAVAAADASPCRDPTVGPGDLMNIQYTSGTTGFPKGCMLTHDYWMVLAQAAASWDAEPCRRPMTAQPFFYMDPQWHVLKSFAVGGTLLVAPGLSASRFTGWIKTHAVDWCQFPILMTRQPEAPDDGATRLKQVATFGWDRETCRAFRARFRVRAREGFGMTEIGLGTLMPAMLDEMFDSESVGLDGPFRETTIRDETGAPVPVGARGELWVRGRGLFLGYWNRPDANEEAFRPAEDGGLPWFRTGDLFEADAQGFLRLVGRLKDMIRRSSENIAAREVEAIVRELAAVEDVAAVPVPDVKRGEEVKIYVQLKPGTAREALPPEAILAHARSRLAAFKVPRYVAFVDGFPRTVSNKIEKRTLTSGASDLTAGAYDAEAGTWR